MSKKLALTVGLISVGLVSGTATAQETTWRMPAAVPEGSFFYENFMERFADNVDTLTDGRLKIEPSGAGVIVPAFEIYDAVQDGVVEAGHSTPTFLINDNAANALFAGFPGGMGVESFVHWIYEGGGLEHLQQFRREEKGLHSLVVGIGTTEVLAHGHEPITSAEDLEGLSYRTAGPWSQILDETFNGSPTTVPPGEIFTLLQRGGVDAIEWATPGSNLSEGFHEITPYMAVPGVHQPTFLWEVVVTEERWNELPDDLKPLVEAAARLTTHESTVHFGHSDIQAMDEYAEAVEITELEQELIDTVQDAGRDWVTRRAEEQAAEGDSRLTELSQGYFEYQDRWGRNAYYLMRE